MPAERLAGIIAEHGPRSVAAYARTMAPATFPTAQPMFTALLYRHRDADGVRPGHPRQRRQAGGRVATGTWGAPPQGF